jgi:hypothetical protein
MHVKFAVLATLVVSSINAFEIFYVCQIVYNYPEALSFHYVSMWYTYDSFKTVVVGEEYVFSFREESFLNNNVLSL